MDKQRFKPLTTPDSVKIFVADPVQGSRHNRGCAVDLTLYDLATGHPVEMTSGYDEFTARAYPDTPAAPPAPATIGKCS